VPLTYLNIFDRQVLKNMHIIIITSNDLFTVDVNS
jgi:hypothetical protein